jgi:hypothetical protein
MIIRNKIFFLLFLLLFLSGCSSVDTININSSATYDGQEILFVKNQEIYAVDADGQNLLNISQNDSNNFFPFWLKQKEVMLFVSEKDDFYRIWKKDLVNNSSDLLWGSKLEPKFISLSPDHNWLIYAEEKTCFLFSIKNKSAQKIADVCDYVAWSDSSRSFVYQQGDTLYLREFNINQQLGEASELFKSVALGAIFLDQKNLLFETVDPESETAKYDLYRFSLDSKILTAVTNLDFSLAQKAQLALSPDKSQLLYNRTDNNTSMPSAWLVNISQTPALAKLVLNNAQEIIWQADSGGFYYIINELDENGDLVENFYRCTKDGLNKEKIQDNAKQIAI